MLRTSRKSAMPVAAEISRIGLIGDVHAEHRYLDAALSFFATQRLDAIVCTGDLADGGGSLETCCDLLRQASVVVVAGNHDRWLLTNRMRGVPQAHDRKAVSDDTLEFIRALPPTRAIETVAGSVLLCHGVGANDMRKVWPGTVRMPVERSTELDDIIDAGRTRLVLNGHMHYRVIVNFDALTLINAGTLKGEHRPGVSIVDLVEDTVTGYEFGPDAGLVEVMQHRIGAGDDRRVWKDTQSFDGRWKPVALYAG